MLLDIKLKVQVTNDGKENISSVSMEDTTYRAMEVLTALKMAQMNIEDNLKTNLDTKGMSDDEIDFTLANITMEQLEEMQMTPKEKAKELVDRYKNFVHGYVGSSFMTGHEYPEQILNQAKKVARITVEEIQKFGAEQGLREPMMYWNSVEKEIGKLKLEDFEKFE